MHFLSGGRLLVGLTAVAGGLGVVSLHARNQSLVVGLAARDADATGGVLRAARLPVSTREYSHGTTLRPPMLRSPLMMPLRSRWALASRCFASEMRFLQPRLAWATDGQVGSTPGLVRSELGVGSGWESNSGFGVKTYCIFIFRMCSRSRRRSSCSLWSFERDCVSIALSSTTCESRLAARF